MVNIQIFLIIFKSGRLIRVTHVDLAGSPVQRLPRRHLYDWLIHVDQNVIQAKTY
ncbi:hypothetical protein C2G38_2103322, partial [Gigaspora rosea]